MGNIEIFENQEFGEIRIITINDEPWFVGKDVCLAFKDTNYRRSLGNIDECDKGVSQIATPGGKQNMTIINESGLYSLLFQMQPQKAKGVSQNDTLIQERVEQLRKFKHWVTSEVLPSVRKHGAYMTNEVIERTLTDPDYLIQLATILKEERQARQLAEQKVEEQKEIISKQRDEIEYKEDVIIGLVDEIDVADKRQILNRVVKHNNASYKDRWAVLYREFDNKYHINTKKRFENYNAKEENKPKMKNRLEYIDKVMNKIPELYEIATKLYENDVAELVKEMYGIAN